MPCPCDPRGIGIAENIMSEMDIDSLTIEQYLMLTEGNQAPGMVKPEFKRTIKKNIEDMTIDEYMRGVVGMTEGVDGEGIGGVALMFMWIESRSGCCGVGGGVDVMVMLVASLGDGDGTRLKEMEVRVASNEDGGGSVVLWQAGCGGLRRLAEMESAPGKTLVCVCSRVL
ncbi:hypothetical protein Tco_0240670 [Tanacetum coccineum]